MTNNGRHTGWLLVYKLFFLLILVVYAIGVFPQAGSNPFGYVLGTLFWLIPVASLYGATDRVIRFNIIFNLLGTVVTLYTAFSTLPPNATGVDISSSLGAPGIFAAWTYYWLNSSNVKRVFPSIDE